MKSNTNYSKIIAGTMTWGSWGKQLSASELVALIQHCLNLGITTFDLADIYGDYTTEMNFGNAFQECKIARSEIQLISKCGIQMTSGREKNKVKHYQYNKEYIVWSAEETLRKLNTDYLDIFLLHRPSPLMQPEEIAEAVLTLKNSGKIKKFGVSNFTTSQIALLETVIPVSMNQIKFSLTANGVMNDGSLDDCMTHKRMVMSWNPLGSYFRKDNKRKKRIEKTLIKLKGKYHANESQLLLAWILKHPASIFPVVGTTDPKRLSESLEALKINIELQDWFLLLEASNGYQAP